jgi:hypothetical protein
VYHHMYLLESLLLICVSSHRDEGIERRIDRRIRKYRSKDAPAITHCAASIRVRANDARRWTGHLTAPVCDDLWRADERIDSLNDKLVDTYINRSIDDSVESRIAQLWSEV